MPNCGDLSPVVQTGGFDGPKGEQPRNDVNREEQRAGHPRTVPKLQGGGAEGQDRCLSRKSKSHTAAGGGNGPQTQRAETRATGLPAGWREAKGEAEAAKKQPIRGLHAVS